MPVTPETAPEVIPFWQQLVAGAGIFVGAGGVWIYRFIKGVTPAEPPEAARHVVLEQANLADMKPLHDINAGVAVLIAELKNLTIVIGGAIEARATEEEIQRRAEIRAAQMLDEIPPRRRRRRPVKPKA